jgi:uncharacterized membrane protein
MTETKPASKFPTLPKISSVAIGLLIIAIYWLLRGNPLPTTSTLSLSNVYKAQVVQVVEEGQIQLGVTLQDFQVLDIQPTEGLYTGTTFQIDLGKRQLRAPGPKLVPGDELLVTISETPTGPSAFFSDFIRTPALGYLLATFVAFTVLISGWKGVRSLLAMAISLTIILDFILPAILQGGDPVFVIVVGSFAILTISLYLVYGWTLKTHAAVLGTLISLTLTGFLATLFVTLTRLTGFGSEEAMFLSQQPNAILNFRGLVLGGIIIGSLGVLDDLVITQASVIFELYLVNPAQTMRELFWRGMRVGRDHVAATVNTLVLAYTGAALPLLLLVAGAGSDWLNLLNRELVAEEVVRTLVGSLGLMAAVPLTTWLACVIAMNMANFGKLRPFLGPAMKLDHSEHSHSHSH